MPDALTAGFEPEHIHREDLQRLTDDELTALKVRAYGASMKIFVCNTAAISGLYRSGMRWRTVFGWCETERERREAGKEAEGRAA